MSGQEDCFSQTFDRLSDFKHLVGVQPCRGFVHDEDFRFVQKNIGHAHPLTKPAGKLSNGLVQNRVQSTLLDYLFDPLLFQGGVHAAGVSEEVEQSEGCHFLVKRTVFGKVTDAVGDFLSIACDFHTANLG